VIVTFAPTTEQEYGKQIVVNANNTSGSNTIPVSGSGCFCGIHMFLTGDLTFGTVPVNTTATRTFRINLVGNAGFEVRSVTFPAGFTGNWTGGTIPANGFQDVVVTFAPTAETTYSGPVVIDGCGCPLTASGTGGPFSGLPGTSATFVRADTTTQGNWIGHYGSNGFAVVNDTTSYPAYAQVNVTADGTYTWQAPTNDARALQYASASGRLASTWYGYASFTIDVDTADGAPHQVALYALDWDGIGRAERIDVKAADGTILDTRTITQFNGGQYLVWTVRGRVSFVVTLTGGANAVLSGLFFDAAGGATDIGAGVAEATLSDAATKTAFRH